MDLPLPDVSAYIPQADKLPTGTLELAMAMTTKLYTGHLMNALKMPELVARAAAEGLARNPSEDWRQTYLTNLAAILNLFELKVTLTLPPAGLPQALDPATPAGAEAFQAVKDFLESLPKSAPHPEAQPAEAVEEGAMP